MHFAWLLFLLACAAPADPPAPAAQLAPLPPAAPAPAVAAPTPPAAPSAATLAPIDPVATATPPAQPPRPTRARRHARPLLGPGTPLGPNDLLGAGLDNPPCCNTACDCFGVHDPERIRRMQEALAQCPGCVCPPCNAP